MQERSAEDRNTCQNCDLHHSFIYSFIRLVFIECFPRAGTMLSAGDTQWAGHSSFHVTDVCPTHSTYKALCKELCKSWFLTSKDHSLTRKKINPYWQYQYTWSHHLAGSTFMTPVSNKVLHSTHPGGKQGLGRKWNLYNCPEHVGLTSALVKVSGNGRAAYWTAASSKACKFINLFVYLFARFITGCAIWPQGQINLLKLYHHSSAFCAPNRPF